jgi:hypothetical protein
MTKTKKAKKVVADFDSLESADGADAKVESTPKYKTVYDLFGGEKSRYSESSVLQYEDKIKSLSMAELQHHAYEVGLLPVTNRKTLEERLIREFDREKLKFKVRPEPARPFESMNDKQKKEMDSILKRGQ